MNYYLNEYYRYPDNKEVFKLVEVTGFIFWFECGHWCTDNVFLDLIRMRTGMQVYKDIQEEINFSHPI